jgi:thiamine pyrophosphokinase
MNFIFILNGEFDTKYELNFFSNYNKIICIDGGYLNFQKLNLNLKPDYIIGDFDSIGKIDIINQNTDKPKVIFKDNQDETDSEFAVKYILKNYSNNDIKNIDFIYAVSTSRIDHLFCNAYLLKKIPININSKIITKYQDIFLLRNSINIKEKEGKTLSVIPITNVKGLTIKGCKWDLENTDLSVGFIGGISNIIEQNLAEISLKEGECIIVITYVLK